MPIDSKSITRRRRPDVTFQDPLHQHGERFNTTARCQAFSIALDENVCTESAEISINSRRHHYPSRLYSTIASSIHLSLISIAFDRALRKQNELGDTMSNHPSLGVNQPWPGRRFRRNHHHSPSSTRPREVPYKSRRLPKLTTGPQRSPHHGPSKPPTAATTANACWSADVIRP